MSEPNKCFWVRVKGQISMGDTLCYRLPDQEDDDP